MYKVKRTEYTAHSTVSLHCTLYTVLYIVQCTKYCTLYTVQSTVHCTLHYMPRDGKKIKKNDVSKSLLFAFLLKDRHICGFREKKNVKNFLVVKDLQHSEVGSSILQICVMFNQSKNAFFCVI